jgi:hypothetical protein
LLTLLLCTIIVSVIMGERERKTPEEWRAEHRAIRKVGIAALQTPEYERLEDQPRYEETDTYELMAIKRQKEFEKLLPTQGLHPDVEKKLTNAPAVEHGYGTMGRVIGYSVTAYAKFCASSNRTPDTRELADLLIQDETFDTLIAKLASVPSPMNVAMEAAARLRPMEYGFGRDKQNPPYEIFADETGQLHIQLNEETQRITEKKMPDFAYDNSQTCPAHGVLLRPLWEDMVAEAATNPALFAHDLGLTTAAS